MDAAITYKRVGRCGLGVELNTPLAKAMGAFGRPLGLILAHLLPNAVVLVALALANADHVAAFWFGLKFALFVLQMKSISLEHEVLEIAGRPMRSAL